MSDQVTSSGGSTPQSSADPATNPPQSVTPQAGAPQSIEKRGRGVHNPDCACVICERKAAKAQKKSESPNQPAKPSGENSPSSSTKKSHLPSKSKPSTSLNMGKKVEAMTNEQKRAQSKQPAQSPQEAAEASLAHSPKEGDWWSKLTSGWSTVIG